MSGIEKGLAAIEARCAKATKGPWSRSDGWSPDDRAIVDTENIYGQPPVGVVAHVVRASQDGKYTEGKEANADFIAHARTDVPTLLAALRRAVEGYEELLAYGMAPHIEAGIHSLLADVARLLGEGERGQHG